MPLRSVARLGAGVLPTSPAAPPLAPPAVRGVGVDLVDVPSFAEQLAQPGTRFAEVFTAGERRDGRSGSAGEPAHLAGRWAAKEAFIKAWSATLYGQPPPLDERVHGDIEVVLDAWRRPRLRLHGRVARLAGGYASHLSISHDGDTAIAYVVLSDPQRRSPATGP